MIAMLEMNQLKVKQTYQQRKRQAREHLFFFIAERCVEEEVRCNGNTEGRARLHARTYPLHEIVS